jgi:hypothetical protein
LLLRRHVVPVLRPIERGLDHRAGPRSVSEGAVQRLIGVPGQAAQPVGGVERPFGNPPGGCGPARRPRLIDGLARSIVIERDGGERVSGARQLRVHGDRRLEERAGAVAREAGGSTGIVPGNRRGQRQTEGEARHLLQALCPPPGVREIAQAIRHVGRREVGDELAWPRGRGGGGSGDLAAPRGAVLDDGGRRGAGRGDEQRQLGMPAIGRQAQLQNVPAASQ